MGKVVVVGSSNTDMVFGTPEMPRPGETVMGSSFDVIQGGKGANQAVAAVRAGAEVTFIARVGEDDLGAQAVDGYRQDGILTDQIITDPAHPTGVAMIMVNTVSGENAIIVAPGANGALSAEDIDHAEASIRQADVLLVQLEVPLPAVRRALETARRYGVATVLNPAPAQELPDDLLALIDYITPNETETERLTGILPENDQGAERAAHELMKKVGKVIITRGSAGAFAATPEQQFNVPAPKVQPVDTTAAGDVFNGYLAAALAARKPLEEAVKQAIAAASHSVTRKGAQPSIPHARELFSDT